MPTKILYYFLLCLLISPTVFSQNRETDSLESLLRETSSPSYKAKIELQLSKAYERLDITKGREYAINALLSDNDSIKSEAYNQIGRSFFFVNELDSAKRYFQNSISLLESIDLKDKVANVRISLGAVELRNGSYEAAVGTFIESLTFFEAQKDSINMAKCYSNISSAFGELGEHERAIEYGQKAMILIRAKDLRQFEIVTLPNLASHYLKTGDTIAAETNYLAAEQLAIELNDLFSQSRIYNNLGNMYLESDPVKAQSYLKRALSIREKSKRLDGIGTLYNNLGYILLKRQNFQEALPMFEKASEISEGTERITVLNNLAETYEGLQDFEKAIAIRQQHFLLNDSILKSDKQKSILELSTKYETEKKEKAILNLQNENLQIDIKRRSNRNLLIIALALLLGTIILGYLILKNLNRKQIIAQQQQSIEAQKVEKLLKDQELIGIDAMLEGQEKERSRIANDLHDNLGSKIATLKLYTDELQNNPESSVEDRNSLFKKVSDITQETYQEVRKMAHSKNFGSYIDKGLIPSTENVAKLISNSNKLKIEVINVDVKRAIENNIEIQIFRCIQELLTNIIKHARATEVVIQFSEEDNILNVIVEDNGEGFVLDNINRGMGLTNISNRMEKIGGELVIDSSPKSGTTVILNIPI